MKKKSKFFFFGFGQVAKYFVRELISSDQKFLFYATNTNKTKFCNFSGRRYKSFKFRDNKYDKNLVQELKNSDYILVSIPPQNKRDIVLKRFSKFLFDTNFVKLIYLSATSVYGNHNGKWVNESSKLKGSTIFGIARKNAERSWINFRKKSNYDVNILRISGIYSKENNVLKKISKQRIYVKNEKYFSRIRVEDLAIIIKKFFFSKKKSMILNATDDKPSTNVEVAKYAAKLLNIKSLQAIPISNFKNKMIKQFYKDSKKVSNKNMKNMLKIRLRYPTYKQGLRNIFNNL